MRQKEIQESIPKQAKRDMRDIAHRSAVSLDD